MKIDNVCRIMQFTIPLHPITKKNSQQIIFAHGHSMIIPSKAYREYERECKKYLPQCETIDYSINLKAIFYRKDKRKSDLSNHLEALQDILVKHKVIADDNYTIVASVDGSRVMVDKENPRTEIIIEKL